MSADGQNTSRLIADHIAASLSSDAAWQHEAVEATLARVEREGRTGGESLAWITSYLAELLLEPSAADDRSDEVVVWTESRPWTRSEWRHELRSQPVAARVALLLHRIAGYDLETTARICRRTTAEIAAICAPTQFPAALPAPVPGPATLPAPPTARPPEPDVLVGAAAPEAAPEAPSEPKRRRWRFPLGLSSGIVIVIALVATITHGGGERPSFAADRTAGPAQRAGCSSNLRLTPGATTLPVGVDTTTRDARVWVPATGKASAALPLVIDLGDDGSEPETRAGLAGLEQLADSEQFVVMTPAPTGSPTHWNVSGDTTRPDDVAFLSVAIDSVSAHTCIDPQRITVVGHGVGAQMAAALACARSDRIAAIAMVSGVAFPPGCAARRAISVLAIVDLYDTVPSGAPAPLDLAMAKWATAAGCQIPLPPPTPDPDGRLASSASGCRPGVEVTSRTSSTGSHDWPGNGARSVWDFLRTASLP